jgi:guanylate cyclase
VRARVLRLLDAAAAPGDDDFVRTRKRLFTAGGLTVPVVLMALGLVYIAYGETVAGLDYCAFATWMWLVLAWFIRHDRIEPAVWAVAIPALPSHLIAVLVLGDLVHSGALVLWGLAFPIATGLIFLNPRKIAVFFVVYVVNVVVVVVLVPSDRSSLPTAAERAILLVNVLSLSTFTAAVLALFVTQRNRAFALLEDQQRQTRRLLLNILPSDIADQLSERPGVIAQQHDAVSVLFCDVVGFTPMAESLPPGEVVGVLDELFSHFDGLVERYGVEKIKTIGDCYMVASGVPRPRADHAVALASLALEMVAAVRDLEFHGRRLQVRIGINSGPVVAGVIGTRKFSYDLWGDVVNTASRMESHGRIGEVQITGTTRDDLGDAFVCEPRGVIDIKGKGHLPVWMIVGPQPERETS